MKNKVKDFKKFLEDYIIPDIKINRRSKSKYPDKYVIQQGTIPSDSGTKETRKFMR